MKNLLLPILFFLVLALHSAAAQSTWRTYSPPDKAFSVELPAKLQKVVYFEGEHGASLDADPDADPKMMKLFASYAAIETTPSESRFGIITVKAELIVKYKMSRAEFLEALSKTFLADDDNTDLLSKPTHVSSNGISGNEYIYVSDRKGDFSLFIRGRIFDVGSRNYVLVFVGRDQKDLNSADAERFFNSFRVTVPRNSRAGRKTS